MAKIEQRPTVTCECTMRLTEPEMRALDAIVGYGWDSFITTFKKHMGQAYIRDHEAGGEELFASVRRTIPSILRRADDARAVFEGSKVAAHPKKEDAQ